METQFAISSREKRRKKNLIQYFVLDIVACIFLFFYRQTDYLPTPDELFPNPFPGVNLEMQGDSSGHR